MSKEQEMKARLVFLKELLKKGVKAANEKDGEEPKLVLPQDKKTA
jgi:hypothetical protein